MVSPLLALAFAGCSLAPPPPVEDDVELQALVKKFSETEPPLELRIGAAPVRFGARTTLSSWGTLAGVAQPSSASAPWEPRDYSAALAPDGARLQRRLAALSQWALGTEVRTLAVADGDPRSAAESEDLDVMVQLDLLEGRTSWIGRDGVVWWADLFLFWGLGALPVVFVPDEVYGVDLRARLHVTEVRSGRSLLDEEFSVSHQDSLNHPQRGWSLGGLFWLHPYTLDEEDLAPVGAALLPHAQALLERRVAAALVRRARPRLIELFPKIRSGELGPRFRALLVGVNGPATGVQALHLQGAENDALALEARLQEAGVATQALTGDQVTQAQLESSLRDLAQRTRSKDRLLLYFAGFGHTDAEGLPALVCADGALPLRRLADQLASWAPGEARIDIVLDASFGSLSGGRTYPGGTKLARGSLGVLVQDRPWRLFCSARPEETAIERGVPSHGLFSHWLLTTLAGACDSNEDREVSLREAWRYLARWVTPEAEEAGASQRPCIWGGDYDLPFLPVVDSQ